MSYSSRRNIFLGANTRYGFKSLYETLLTDYENYNVTVYILKGGPGTGKSTFVKKVIGLLESLGCSMDVVHCSGDPLSLDGVISTEGGIAVVDGTSPHMIDPMCPGAREEIINLGAFWDTSFLVRYRDDIIQFMKDKSDYYKRAYHYLQAAGIIYDDTVKIMEESFEKNKAYLFASNLADEILGDFEPSLSLGKDKKLFATAITPAGLMGSVNEIFKDDKVYSIDTTLGMSTSSILEVIKVRANLCGFNTESFLCGFDTKLEHIRIPELKTAVVSSNPYHEASGSDMYYEYPLEGFLSEYDISRAKDDIKYNSIRFDELLNKAIRMMTKSKKEHSKLEEIYIASMDFDELNAYIGEAMKDIEGVIQMHLSN